MIFDPSVGYAFRLPADAAKPTVQKARPLSAGNLAESCTQEWIGQNGFGVAAVHVSVET